MKKAVIIGAGIGGLSAAIELASRGVQVLVLEARLDPGGKAGIALLDGVEVDTGPSLLTLPDVFEDVLAVGGARLEDEVTLLRPSPAFRYLYPDGVRVDIHHEVSATLASVRDALGTDAEAELDRFLAYAKRIWAVSADAFVLGEAPSFSSLLRFGLWRLAQVRDIDATRTMAQAIHAQVKSPHLRDLLLRYATYNGSNPFQAPATLNCIAHVELAIGGFGVKGGLHELVRALVRVAERAGAEIQYGAPVTEIVVQSKTVTGVKLKGGPYLRADAVIANADPEHVFRHLLPESLGKKLRTEATPSTSGFTAILRAKRDPARAPHTVLFPDEYRAEFSDLFDRDRPPETPTVYLCDQEAAHGRAGWADAAPVFVMANAPAEPEAGHRAEEVWQRLESTVRARLHASGLATPEEPFVWRRTPRGLAATFPGSRGALYGAASNSTFAAFKRPPNRLLRPRRLYLASGGAHPGGGLPLCASSGRAAARAVLEDLGLENRR